MYQILVLILCFLFSGCHFGLNPDVAMLSERAFEGEKFNGVSIAPKNTALMPQKYDIFLKRELEEYFTKNGFNVSGALKIEYSILVYNYGYDFLRWLFSGLLEQARGKLEIEVIFKGSNGEELEKKRYTYNLHLAETMQDALEDFASRLYTYVSAHFLNTKTPNAS